MRTVNMPTVRVLVATKDVNHTHPLDTYPSERDLVPDIPTPQKGPGTRDTYPREGTWYQKYLPHCEQVDRPPVKILPSYNNYCGR